MRKIQKNINSGKLNVKTATAQDITTCRSPPCQKKKKKKEHLAKGKNPTRKSLIQDACQGVCRVNKP